MGSLTAQILVGDAHSCHGGINPAFYLFLSENSHPAWILVNQNIFEEPINFRKGGRVKKTRIIWIPSIENMLEDALLMIALYVIKNRQIIDLFQKICQNSGESHLEIYEKLTGSQRDECYQECRRIKNLPKIVVTVTRGSTIQDQLSVLKKYSIEAELCVSN
ncbi:MAG: hypothetical protein NTV68_15600 [Methanomicrobiales archaeon]|nr:hypothetical protein [Methanomicrobiales archaeon]